MFQEEEGEGKKKERTPVVACHSSVRTLTQLCNLHLG